MEINIVGKSLVVRLDNSCERCGSYTYDIRYKKPHIGLYCKCCGKYIKWLSKAEKQQFGVVTPEDFKSNGIGAKFTLLDDVPTNKITDAQLIKDDARHNYEEEFLEELPWYD